MSNAKLLARKPEILSLLEENRLRSAKKLVFGILGDGVAAYRVWFLLGNLSVEGQLMEQAVKCYQASLKSKSDFLDAHMHLGVVLRLQGKLDASRRHFRYILGKNPRSVNANYNLGGVLAEMGNRDGAIACYHKVLEENPGHAYAINNLGNLLRDKAMLDKAIECFSKVVDISPDTRDVDFYTGMSRLSNGQLVPVKPEHAVGHWNLGMALLLQGKLDRGWKAYEWRKLSGLDARRLPVRPWDGSSLAGKTILVFGEQGIGDEIMFASMFPDILESAGHCIIQCDPRLVPLFERSFPAGTIVGGRTHAHRMDWLKNTPDYDTQISSGSIPQFLRNTCADFPVHDGYLSADREETEKWRRRLVAIGDGLKIGISWRGGALPQTQLARSISIEQWEPILSIRGCDFISLQYGDVSNERKFVREQIGVELHDWQEVDPLVDLDSFAAQVCALDLVISIDNSTVHLSGALGVSTWTILPAAPDWRWFDCKGSSPWYPQMRLFRQAQIGHWHATLLDVANALKKLVTSNRS